MRGDNGRNGVGRPEGRNGGDEEGGVRKDPVILAGPVFDFSDVGRIDLPALAIILTARELLPEENRQVWVAGLPGHFWSSMEAMGLEGYFTPFPGRRGIRA